MTKSSRYVVLASFALALATVGAQAAETVKLRALQALYTDSKGEALKGPEGVACGPGGLVVIADAETGRLVQQTIAATEATPRIDWTVPQVNRPIRVQVNSKGEVFALDGKTHRIARVGADGQFGGFLELGAAGQRQVMPRSLAIGPADLLYVLDVHGGRVIVLDPDGKPRREVKLPTAGFFADLAVDAKGSIFLLDSVGRRVLVAKGDAAEATPFSESLSEDLDFPTSIAVDDRGHVFVGDENGGGIVILGADGSFRGRQSNMGWKEGLLRHPADLCVSDKGLLFVADRGNRRLQVFAIVQ